MLGSLPVFPPAEGGRLAVPVGGLRDTSPGPVVWSRPGKDGKGDDARLGLSRLWTELFERVLPS